MEASALTISEKKFRKLSTSGQHHLLAELARRSTEDQRDPSEVLRRYDQLHSWVNLDRFIPAPWLSDVEAVAEIQAFHALRASKQTPAQEKPVVSWQPHLQIDVVLEGVRSPYNIGSILRLMDNFGFAQLIHTQTGLRHQHPQLVKAARGAQDWIPIHLIENLPHWLAASGKSLCAVEEGPNAIPLPEWNPPTEACLILGNETYGVSQHIREMCHQTVCVPTVGFKRSMNVSHAFAVVAQRILEKHGRSCK